MVDLPNKRTGTAELGVAGAYDPSHQLKHDEFLYQLRGTRAMRMYREMRENDPVIGSILMSMDMMMRAIDWRVEAVDDSQQATEAKEFVEGVLFEDMESTFPELISEIVTFLPFGFSFFELVFKRRMGRNARPENNQSKFNDGRIGVRKIAPRAQWTIDRFEVEPSGRVLGAYQRSMALQHALAGEIFIPMSKALLFRTTSANNDPSGRSVLRNAFLPYHYVKNIQSIEAIAIERELNGLPVGRVPAEYLKNDATDAQKDFVQEYERILRDVRRNEQSHIILPSDVYRDANGNPTNTAMVSFELAASKGTRDIDTGKVIQRHQQNIARTVLADFLMLGQSDRGSFALSKSKTDLFLRSIEGYTHSIGATFTRHFLPKLWHLNGFDEEYMPKIVPGPVSPVDLDELGKFVERLFGASEGDQIPDDLRDQLLGIAGFNRPDEEPGTGNGPPVEEGAV